MSSALLLVVSLSLSAGGAAPPPPPPPPPAAPTDPGPPPPPPPPSAPAPAPAPNQPNAPPDRAGHGPAVAITIESNRPGTELFELVTGEVRGWGIYGPQSFTVSRNHRICREPCKGVLSGSDGDFFVGGEGIVESAPFTLAGAGKAVTLHVDAGSTALRGLGKFGLIFGCIATGIGALATLYTGVLYDRYYGVNTPVLGGAIAITGVGLAALIGGIVLMVNNNTQVRIDAFDDKSAPPPPRPSGAATM